MDREVALSQARQIKLEVSPMTEADLQEVLAIEQRSFISPWLRGAFLYELQEKERSRLLVAREARRQINSGILAYADLWLTPPEAHLTNFAVHPDFRRRGVGEQFVGRLLALLPGWDCQRITLEVRASNTPARRLYEKCGFLAIAMVPGYYTDTREDAVVMWHQLSFPLAQVGG